MRHDIVVCPVCGCPIQRTREGTLEDGCKEHSAVCHPDQIVTAE